MTEPANIENIPDGITVIPLAEGIRRRPAMYLGSRGGKGIANLICGLFSDCIALCATDYITFAFSLLRDGKFSIDIFCEKNLAVFLAEISPGPVNNYYLYVRALAVLAENLEIISGGYICRYKKGKLEMDTFPAGPVSEGTLHFELDKTVMTDTDVDYFYLCDSLYIHAMMARGAEIVVKDDRPKYRLQSYYCFPEGYDNAFKRLAARLREKPLFEFAVGKDTQGGKYQVAIGYQRGGEVLPLIRSYANEGETIEGGSLVNGVISGLILACRNYITEKKLVGHNVTRKRLLDGLIMVCAIRGDKFEYCGSTKDKIYSAAVRRHARQLAADGFYSFLINNAEKAAAFIWRFEDSEQADLWYGKQK